MRQILFREKTQSRNKPSDFRLVLKNNVITSGAASEEPFLFDKPKPYRNYMQLTHL